MSEKKSKKRSKEKKKHRDLQAGAEGASISEDTEVISASPLKKMSRRQFEKELKKL